MKNNTIKLALRLSSILMMLSLSGCFIHFSWYDEPLPAPLPIQQGKTAELIKLEQDLLAFSDEVRALSESRHIAKGSIKALTNDSDRGDIRLQKRVTINRWHGGPAPLLDQLSKGSGYSFKETGLAPTHTKLIRIDVNKEKIIDVYFEIGMQLGNSADIVIDEVSSRVLLVHKVNK